MPGKTQTSVLEEQERKKIDLRIEVEDFGPISSGGITLKPLTVFIGPNNSGKSYAAMLIHSIFESYSPIVLMRDAFLFAERGFDISPEGIPELKRQVDGLKKGEELDLPIQSIEAITKKVVEEIYQKRLADKVVRSFACPIEELVSIRKSSFTLRISHGSYSIHLACREDKLEIRDHSKEYPRSKVRIRANGEHGYSLQVDLALQDGLSFSEVIRSIANAHAFKLLRNVAMQCHYLPAARSGILQLYKAVARGIVREVTDFSIARPQIPEISGVVSDLILYLMSLPGEKGHFSQLAQDFEEELIRGEVIVPTPSEHLYPEIKYSFQGTEIPLHRSSSTVSELAPLFLYLKYKVKPNSILMIEEPEAHLHPGNQRILARLLVRLVRQGVNIIITTHSEYLLEQLRNFILLSKVEPKKRIEKYEYTEEDYLKTDEFAAYVFHYDKESAGHRIDELEITEDGEFSQDEFVKVIDALYEETIKLRIDLSDEA